MAYRDTADVNERRRAIDYDPAQDKRVQELAYNNLDATQSCETMGAAMEPTLVNNLTEEINGLRRRLEKLEKLRQALMDNHEVRNLHGAINIF